MSTNPTEGWDSFQRYLVAKFVEKDHLPLVDAESKARHYNFWSTLGYKYEEMMDLTKKHDRRVKKKEIKSNEGFPKELWEELDSKRDKVAKNVSVGKGINFMLKYFQSLQREEERTRTDGGEAGGKTKEVKLEGEEKRLGLLQKNAKEVVVAGAGGDTAEEGEYVEVVVDDKDDPNDSKRMFLSEAERTQWGKVSENLEMELDLLTEYCKKVEKYYPERRNENPYKIILELANNMQEKELTLMKVKTKLVDALSKEKKVVTGLELFRTVFGGGRKKTELLEMVGDGPGSGANSAPVSLKDDVKVDSEDTVEDATGNILKDLFDRFCLYVICPESMAEDLPSSKTLVGLLLKEERWRYKMARDKGEWKCPSSHHDLHSFLFYDYRVRGLISGTGEKRSGGELDRCRDIVQEIVKEMTTAEPVKREVWEKALGNILLISSTPSTCLPHMGELAMVSDSQLGEMVGLLVKHVADLGKLEKIEIEVSSNMSSKKEQLLMVMEVLKLSLLPDHMRRHTWVFARVLNEYFTMVRCKVNISETRMKVHGKGSSWPELEQFLVFCYLEQAVQMTRGLEGGKLSGFQVEMIDTLALMLAVTEEVTAVCETGLDMFKAVKMFIQGTLFIELKKINSKQISTVSPVLIRLIHDFIECKVKRSLFFLPISRRDRDKLTDKVVEMLGNGQMVAKEKLGEISYEQGQKTVKFTITDIEDIKTFSSQDPVPPPPSIPYTVPISLYTEKEVVLPPQTTRTLLASLAGLPSLPIGCPLLISPLQSDSGLVPDVLPLLPDYTVHLQISNTTSHPVCLTPGQILGTAHPQDWTCCQLVTPSYCLQLVRQVNVEQGVLGIEEVDDELEFVRSKLNIKKNMRTNFSISGSLYCRGVQDFYTVEAVVFFLKQMQKTDSYVDYLREAFLINKEVVKEKDYVDMLGYMSGTREVQVVCRQVRNQFDEEASTQLKELMEKSKSWDLELGWNDVNKNLKSELPNPKEMMVSPNKLLVHRLGKYLLYDLDMEQQQAKETINMLVIMLADVGYDLNTLRLEYHFGVPDHRVIFQEVILEKLVEKLSSSEEIVKLRCLTAENLAWISQPAAGSEDFLSLLGLANFFKTTLDSEFNNNLESFSKQSLAVEELSTIYYSLMDHMADPKSLSPLSQSGLLKLFTSTSKHSQASLLVQLKDEEYKPVSFSARQLTPREREQAVSKVEREALAVIWGLEVNVDSLMERQGSLVVVVYNKRVKDLFLPNKMHTAYWWDKLTLFGNVSVEIDQEAVNPVIVLAKNKKDGMQMAFKKEQLVKEMIQYMLKSIKMSNAGRNRWVRERMETLLKEKKMVRWEEVEVARRMVGGSK